jgi:hypothetical protein
MDVAVGEQWGVADLAAAGDDELLALSSSIEQARRGLEARHVRVLTEIERRALHTIDGHRGIEAWGRAVHRWTYAEAKSKGALIKLGRAAPDVLDRLQSGQLGVAQAHLLASTFVRPRIGALLLDVLPTLLDAAAQMSWADFDQHVTNWRLLADQDGADPERSMRHRAATLSRSDYGFSFHANGPAIDAAELAAVLKLYEQAQWDADWAWTKAEYGQGAVPGLMPRTVQQRRYDAFIAILRDAVATPAGSTPNEPLVNLMLDDLTFDETITTLFGGTNCDGTGTGSGCDGDGPTSPTDPNHRRRTSAVRDPMRRCSQTTDGHFVPPVDIVLAALRGQIRRVVTDHRGVVLDLGRRRRLFTGANRQAVLLSATRCTHPGCLVAAESSQADHLTAFSHGGHTKTCDAGPACGHHNRWRYTSGATTVLDDQGHWTTRRADGTDIAPPDRPAPAA